jgi:hypothetical protein
MAAATSPHTNVFCVIGYFNNCNLGSLNNALPGDGVTALKHVGAVLM